MSVPNQKIVRIHKTKYKENFLQISIDEWQAAVRKMNLSEFALYLYLAGNANGFNLELSRQAFENATGYKKTAYNDAVKKLIKLGYLIQKQGNIYDFYTSPRRESKRAPKSDFSFGLSGGNPIPPPRSPLAENPNASYRPSNTEIDNINKTDKINNVAKEKKREQAYSISEILDGEEDEPYIPLRQRYNAEDMSKEEMIERMRAGF